MQWLVVAAIAGDCFYAAEPPGHLAIVVKRLVYPLIMAVDVGFAFRFGMVCLQASAVSVFGVCNIVLQGFEAAVFEYDKISPVVFFADFHKCFVGVEAVCKDADG